MASSKKQMIRLEALHQGNECMAEKSSAKDLVNVITFSRSSSRRKFVIIIAVVAVVLIVAGVLIGIFIPNYMGENDDANCK